MHTLMVLTTIKKFTQKEDNEGGIRHKMSARHQDALLTKISEGIKH